MRNNADSEQKKKIVDFIVNFLKNEGFSDIAQPEIADLPNVKVEDRITREIYTPTLSAQKDGKLYFIEVETGWSYNPERILKWKLYIQHLEEREGVFWMFVPSISKEIFEASLKQNKLEELVQLVAY